MVEVLEQQRTVNASALVRIRFRDRCAVRGRVDSAVLGVENLLRRHVGGRDNEELTQEELIKEQMTCPVIVKDATGLAEVRQLTGDLLNDLLHWDLEQVWGRKCRAEGIIFVAMSQSRGVYRSSWSSGYFLSLDIA